MKKLLTSNEAISEAVKLAKPDVIAAYPITPQSPIVEKLSEMVDSGELDSRFVRVESEHSAMGVVIGAATAGARVFTATSSHGLAYMYEMCWWAAGSRLPIVMALAARSIGAPWNIHGDHLDLMAMRDLGWIISVAENAQEAFDMTLNAFMLSEEVNIPVAVAIDGFTMSHTAEVVEVGEVEIPPRKQAYRILPGMDVALNAVTFGEARMTARYDLAKDLENSAELIEKEYGGLVERYRLEDADYAVVVTGGLSGDVKDAVDMLREEGVKMGVLRLKFIRPFPKKAVKSLPSQVLVVDRANTDLRGTLSVEVAACGVENVNVVAGIGGRYPTVEELYSCLKRFADGKLSDVEWLI
ncbi:MULTISPECIES: pyruvate ferredoxin oxidoreductase [Archaeoglobus]|jgi:pyruvate ferredoxin oxidoreductase alpha subunit|uniref:Pyruvate:ferredoxin oxidoreductase, alpha subunit n=2 Tax=Archaeoglobus fulgidus TaxID=2234 RepID=A0A075WNE3_ARCFL|nr:MULTISPECIES: pyruvate ferredoxin oxidoreductase [Archaeoglobus]AIG99043.1 Pyruvate:ferredoxin oxidoreductase, alpha subunit [Archaeoglobus fulgidus DSM 8774]KUJ93389.1 MAG: 2-ketoisovalerate ferredoxin oxidoreductase, subunit alpha (VorA) [Archaeoglobus fulgidus]KUK05694.1 MAG: 2-ketoisovalerate ferredoxin oxidoreductase, subunit alpha (VorA) [Archaeoglobus fulgidus]MDI3496922.1 pyruvate ferredoxin oxidoreductase alpha subunit [Archaeoglobus sp.]